MFPSMPATNCVGFAGCGVPLNFTSVVKVCAGDVTAAATQNTATTQAIFPNFSFRIQLSSSGFVPGKIAPGFVFLFTRDTSARRRTGLTEPKESHGDLAGTGRQLGPKLRNIICEARLPVNCERTCVVGGSPDEQNKPFSFAHLARNVGALFFV